ncbi:MAG: DUF6359 domain-containing protein [Bacteroidaceae bacterium]
MRTIPFWILIICIFFCACDKEVLEPDKPSKNDSTEIVPPKHGDSTFVSVGMAQTLFEEQGEVETTVRGYIVGCISGTSLSGALFEPPFSSQSNLLIADDSDNVIVTKCFPVSLAAGTDYRKNLNLKDHPNLLHRKVAFQGYLQKYFRVVGMKKVFAYDILSDSISHKNCQ